MAECIKASNLNSIDLSSSDITTCVSLLKQACMDSGFFYVTNHGISEEFMDQVFTQSKNFFDLPLEEKMKLLRNEKHRGYTPVLDELLDPANQIHGDHKEGFYIGIELPEDDPQAQRTFYGPNLWPDSDILPGWRQTMEKYHQQALEVVRKIARLIALALDLDANFFEQPEMLGEPIAILRLLHYEAQASDPAKGIYGAGAHSDYGLITLLATDSVSGLQICKDKDTKPQVWEYVEPLKEAFVVNLGDMLERWSNGVFRSTLHRVLLGNGEDRYSIPYFVLPGHDCVVECLPTCQSEQNPPKCGKLAMVRTSWTDSNPGRRFLSCPDPEATCPRFLGWVDPPMCARAVVIIPGLLRARNRADEEKVKMEAKIAWKNKVIVVLLILLGLQFARSMFN